MSGGLLAIFSAIVMYIVQPYDAIFKWVRIFFIKFLSFHYQQYIIKMNDCFDWSWSQAKRFISNERDPGHNYDIIMTWPLLIYRQIRYVYETRYRVHVCRGRHHLIFNFINHFVVVVIIFLKRPSIVYVHWSTIVYS